MVSAAVPSLPSALNRVFGICFSSQLSATSMYLSTSEPVLSAQAVTPLTRSRIS